MVLTSRRLGAGRGPAATSGRRQPPAVHSPFILIAAAGGRVWLADRERMIGTCPDIAVTLRGSHAHARS